MEISAEKGIDPENAAQKMFQDTDVNNDNALDIQEVKDMIESATGEELSDNVLQALMVSIDTDGNGEVDMGAIPQVAWLPHFSMLWGV